MIENQARACSVAIFAHNLSGVIVRCIESVLASKGKLDLRIYVLANGCTDGTICEIERQYAEVEHVNLINIPIADKANAWNHYVHRIATIQSTHIFIDGDVVPAPDSLIRLIESLDSQPEANAVGAVPSVGRDRAGWVHRMIRFGRVSGGLYGLTGKFVNYLISNQIKIPNGFVGEDFLLSAWAKDLWGSEGLYTPNPKLVIEERATFAFRQLSLMRLADAKTYFKRLVRYRLRDYQLGMLMHYFESHGIDYIPLSVEEIYQLSGKPPGYYWRGKSTPIDWLTVFKIRQALRRK